jgi:hypothetical protein
VNKEEEKHEDLGGAIDPEKPMACSASREGIYYRICWLFSQFSLLFVLSFDSLFRPR